MENWWIIFFSTLLLTISFRRQILYKWNLKGISRILEKMIQNARTISFTHTNTQNKIPVEIVSKIYQLIPFYKNEQQNLFQRENHLKQDMINIPNNLLTSLTSIKILFELITDPTIPEAEKKEYISIFQKKMENLMIMTNEFHELSKNETTDKPLVMEQQFLDKIVAEAMFFSMMNLSKNRFTSRLMMFLCHLFLLTGMQRTVLSTISLKMHYIMQKVIFPFISWRRKIMCILRQSMILTRRILRTWRLFLIEFIASTSAGLIPSWDRACIL